MGRIGMNRPGSYRREGTIWDEYPLGFVPIRTAIGPKAERGPEREQERQAKPRRSPASAAGKFLVTRANETVISLDTLPQHSRGT